MDLKEAIRSVHDFPVKGIIFRDITTLLNNPEAFKHALDLMQKYCEEKNPDYIVGIESRGFIFGAALADRLGVGFVPIRKVGKLPAETIQFEYKLEYGTDKIEIHADAIKAGQKVVIIDDLIATGGTLEATCKLIEKMGVKVAGVAALIDLAFLPWREKVKNYDIYTVITYDSE